MDFVRILATALAGAVLLLGATHPGAAQYRALHSVSSPAVSVDSLWPAAPETLAEPGRPVSVLQHAAVGTLVGAAAGVAAFLVVETTVEHTDHSEDGLVFFMLAIPATGLGAVVGLVTGLIRNR